MPTRRTFLAQSSGILAGLALPSALPAAARQPAPAFRISLAEWSLHKALFRGELHPLDFPVVARRTYGIDAVEYVNAFFLRSGDFTRELARRADGEGVKSLLIMVDDEGRLGDPDEALRRDAVDRHRRWIDTAKALGCHSIRVNARSAGAPDEQMRLMADGLRRLAEHGAAAGVNVLIENHGGLSSDGEWLAGLMKLAGHPRVGTLPDFGNWRQTEWGGPDGGAKAAEFDRYRGVELMMPFAKGVSAKSHDFDAAGNETSTDFARMLRIVRAHGYAGYVGIEYEGARMSERDGILATKRLLERERERLAAG